MDSGRPIKITATQFKLQLNDAQRNVYEQMARTYRWAYNEAVAHYRTLKITEPDQWSTKRGYEIRDHVLAKATERSWTGKFPRKLIQQGAEEFTKAVKSSWALYKSKLSQPNRKRQPARPSFRYRLKADASSRWRFTLPKGACTMTDGRIFLSKNVLREQWGITDGATVCQRIGKRGFGVEQAFGPDHHPLSEIAICKLIGGEIVIRLTCYAQEVPVGKDMMTGGGVAGAERGDGAGTIPGSENQAARVAISLDPGKRTFLTGYMNEVGCGDVDVDLNARLLALRQRLQNVDDALAGRYKDMSYPPRSKTRRRLIRRRRAIESRTSAIVDDAHWKLAHWLCGVADDIVLGKFYVPGIVKGCLCGSTKWVLLRQRHCLFRQRLLHVAGQYRGVKLHLQNEAYTTKTCTHCGTLNERVGASKTFACGSCGKVFDRDHNASRNVMLRWLAETGGA
jgi:transposase